MTIAVSDMGPLHYLVILGVEGILPKLFDRLLTTQAVLAEMSRPSTPEVVRLWAAAPPPWLEIREPTCMVSIPSLGKKGARDAGEITAISLAVEVRSDFILMDDRIGRREASNRGLRPLWTLQILDEAAERGLLLDIDDKLDRLEHDTPFFVGDAARAAIGAIKRRAAERSARKPGERP